MMKTKNTKIVEMPKCLLFKNAIGNESLLLFFLLFFLSGFNMYAQNNLKSWNSAQLELSLTKKLDMRFSHLRAYDINNGFSSDFSQSSAHLDYDFTKRFSMSAGAVLGSLSAADDANRATLRATFKTPVADVLTWSNSIQGEIHSANQNRYRERIVLIARLGAKNRLDFLRLSPSVSYSLYYNIGGSPIQYYDKNEQPVIQQTPDGFHRGRLSFNMNSRIAKHFSFTVYYMMQREFNLLTDDYHKINVADANTGKIIRPFNDYNVIGTTMSFNFDLYKKKKNSAKKVKKSDN